MLLRVWIMSRPVKSNDWLSLVYAKVPVWNYPFVQHMVTIHYLKVFAKFNALFFILSSWNRELKASWNTCTCIAPLLKSWNKVYMKLSTNKVTCGVDYLNIIITLCQMWKEYTFNFYYGIQNVFFFQIKFKGMTLSREGESRWTACAPFSGSFWCLQYSKRVEKNVIVMY